MYCANTAIDILSLSREELKQLKAAMRVLGICSLSYSEALGHVLGGIMRRRHERRAHEAHLRNLRRA